MLELIDKRVLRSREYRNIYHSDLLYNVEESGAIFGSSLVLQEPSIQQLNDTVVKNTRTGSSLRVEDENGETPMLHHPTIDDWKSSRTKRGFGGLQAFDPVLSENFLTKIEVQELREENIGLI